MQTLRKNFKFKVHHSRVTVGYNRRLCFPELSVGRRCHGVDLFNVSMFNTLISESEGHNYVVSWNSISPIKVSRVVWTGIRKWGITDCKENENKFQNKHDHRSLARYFCPSATSPLQIAHNPLKMISGRNQVTI